MIHNSTNIVFWGTSEFSVGVLNALKERNILPALIISTPNKPQGRKLEIKPTETKKWALENNVEILQPIKLDDEFFTRLSAFSFQLSVVASYGKIIPERFLNIPAHKTLNVHPSLLPKFRGPSPIESAILNDEKVTGVTIIELDKEMDHGPIIAQKKYTVAEWPNRIELEQTLAKVGANLLADIMQDYIDGKIEPKEQDHASATFCKKISKAEAEINLGNDPYQNFLKIQAFAGWPNAYFFIENKGIKIRVVIKEAKFENNELKIVKVIPEGKKEMSYEDFMRGIKG